MKLVNALTASQIQPSTAFLLIHSNRIRNVSIVGATKTDVFARITERDFEHYFLLFIGPRPRSSRFYRRSSIGNQDSKAEMHHRICFERFHGQSADFEKEDL